MSAADFSIHDVMFRRTAGNECDIVVFGETVGSVMKRPDIANPDGGWFYAIHLADDSRGPVLVDDRDAVRSEIARMMIEPRPGALDAAAGASGVRPAPAQRRLIRFLPPPQGDPRRHRPGIALFPMCRGRRALTVFLHRPRYERHHDRRGSDRNRGCRAWGKISHPSLMSESVTRARHSNPMGPSVASLPAAWPKTV